MECEWRKNVCSAVLSAPCGFTHLNPEGASISSPALQKEKLRSTVWQTYQFWQDLRDAGSARFQEGGGSPQDSLHLMQNL